MAFQNPLIAKWQAGQPTLGAWLTTPDSSIAEYIAACGYDEVCADQQHSNISVDSLAGIFQGIAARGSVPTTRVPFNDYTAIGKSLDLGALAVIIPMVNNRAEAARAVSAFRYPPRGLRSAGPVRAPYVMGDDPKDLERAAVVVMVETKGGLANVDEIASTPGVDAVYIGPGDLALALGMSWSSSERSASENEAHSAAVEHVRKTCERHGVAPGIHVSEATLSATYIEQGFRMVTVSADLGLIMMGGRADLALVRAAKVPHR
jgi:4-hydroxy-2-oxoheptanedioate aldolase